MATSIKLKNTDIYITFMDYSSHCSIKIKRIDYYIKNFLIFLMCASILTLGDNRWGL